MVLPKQLLATIESALLGSSPPSPSQRMELMHAIRSSLSPVTPTNSKRGSNSSPPQVKPVELQPKEAPDITTVCLSLQRQQQHVQDHAIGATMACWELNQSLKLIQIPVRSHDVHVVTRASVFILHHIPHCSNSLRHILS
ncbi:hypothetical protein TB2_017878 [Malus domestica]